MAREYGKIFVRIWGDADFRALTGDAQRLFFQMISQPDVSAAGVLTLAPQRWAMQVGDQDNDDINRALAELEQSKFVVVDHLTQEALIRSFIRTDEGFKSWLTVKGIDSSVRNVLSTSLKAHIRDELRRIDTSIVSDRVIKALDKPAREYVEDVFGSLIADFDAYSLDLPEAPSQGDSESKEIPLDKGLSKGHNKGLGKPHAKGSHVTTSTSPTTSTSNPTTTSTSTSTTTSSSSETADAAPGQENQPATEIVQAEIITTTERPDVEALLDRLDQRIQDNGNRTPKRNKTNHDAMRLLLDRDGYTTDQIAAIIDWSQQDHFWHTNILSATKLREKFSQLVAKARASQTDRRTSENERILNHWANTRPETTTGWGEP